MGVGVKNWTESALLASVLKMQVSLTVYLFSVFSKILLHIVKLC